VAGTRWIQTDKERATPFPPKSGMSGSGASATLLVLANLVRKPVDRRARQRIRHAVAEVSVSHTHDNRWTWEDIRVGLVDAVRYVAGRSGANRVGARPVGQCRGLAASGGKSVPSTFLPMRDSVPFINLFKLERCLMMT
jgi:hypothetical protein